MTIHMFSLKAKGSKTRDLFLLTGKPKDSKEFWDVLDDDGWYDRRTFKFIQDLSIFGPGPSKPSIENIEIDDSVLEECFK